MSTKENYEKKLQTQLDEWETEIDMLKANANHAASAPHPQTLATSKHQTLDKLQSLKKDSAPQTLATSKHQTLDKLQSGKAGHIEDPQTIATSEHVAHIEALQSMHESAREKLAELKEASDDTWEDLKPSIESIWKSLGSALRPGHHF
tara:strand:- start:4243 stop:4686 length:444 start_codon:yes stop_codon:yes gene_type:complete